MSSTKSQISNIADRRVIINNTSNTVVFDGRGSMVSFSMVQYSDGVRILYKRDGIPVKVIETDQSKAVNSFKSMYYVLVDFNPHLKEGVINAIDGTFLAYAWVMTYSKADYFEITEPNKDGINMMNISKAYEYLSNSDNVEVTRKTK